MNITKGDAFDLKHGPVGRQRYIVNDIIENGGIEFASLRSVCAGHNATVALAEIEAKAENVETGGAKSLHLASMIEDRKAAKAAGDTKKVSALTPKISALRSELSPD